jgi:putative GTP pyrophosphokinase
MASLSFDQEKTAFQLYYSEKYQTFRDAEIQFRTLIASLLSQVGDFAEVPTVISRVKSESECLQKFQRKYQTELEKQQTPYEIKEFITDLIGVRVTCLYESEVPEVARVVKENFSVLGITDKIAKLESTDAAFGYKGLHLDLTINEARRQLPEYGRYRDLQFEIQIRTVIQDGWSILDHKIKYKRAIPTPLKRRINVLAALFELADHEFLAIGNETKALEQRAREQVGTERPVVVAAEELPPASDDEPFLNVFQFLEIAATHFPAYPFHANKADGFVQELLKWKSDLTAADLATLLLAYLPVVHLYDKHIRGVQSRWLNPFTEMRHALFLSDPRVFRWALYDLQRDSFNQWLETSAPHPLVGFPSLSREGKA